MGNQNSSDALSSSRHRRVSLQTNLVQQSNRLEDAYDISDQNLGEGSSTEIKEGTLKKYTKSERTKGVAIKLYDGKAEIQPDLKLEAAILRECDHPNIVKLFEVARVGKSYSLVLELCRGGPVMRRSPFTEKQASHIVRQICSAVAYLHSKNIVHRDIECSNIMYATTQENSDIKLVDFGSAVELDLIPNKPGAFKFLKEKTGSMHIMAPEVIKQRYGPKVDVWSIGIVTYMILNNGKKPISGMSIQDNERKILQGSVDYRGWSHSEMSKQFVQETAMVNAGQRLSAAGALKHPWVEKTIAKKNLPNELVVSFDLFRMAPTMKRIALNALAKKSPPSTYSSIWNALDSTESGTLSRQEFMEGFKHTGSSEEELSDLFYKLDVNCNGEILYTEFLAATLENENELEEGQIREAFDLIAKNKKTICKKDVQKVMGAKRKKKTDQDRLKEEINDIFTNQEKIDYETFAQMFEHGYIHQTGMDAIVETSLNEEQLSRLREDEQIAHMATIKEGY